MKSENLAGALLMMAAMAAFTVNDTIMKHLGTHLPMFQTMLWRGVLISVALYVLAWRAGAFRVQIARSDRWLIVLRTLADTCSTVFFLQALYHMPIANLTAIMQSLPLTVTLGAALVFREPLGWRRLLAIAVGFIGVLLIVRPGTEGYDRYALFALICVLVVTVRDLATRRMSRAVPSLRVAFWNAFSVTILGAIGASTEAFIAPSANDMALLVVCASCMVAALIMAVMAVRRGELGFVTPFRYTGLIWALILGFLVFGDWPRPLTFIGAALIVGTGLFTLYRERRLRAAKSRALHPS